MAGTLGLVREYNEEVERIKKDIDNEQSKQRAVYYLCREIRINRKLSKVEISHLVRYLYDTKLDGDD